MSKFTINNLSQSSDDEKLLHYASEIYNIKGILLSFIEENSIETILEDREFWSMVHKYLKKIYSFTKRYSSLTFKTVVIKWLSVLKQIGNKHIHISHKIIDGPVNLIMSFILKQTIEISPWFFRILVRICCEFIEHTKLYVFEEKLLASLFKLHIRYTSYHLKRTVISSIIQYFDKARICNFIKKEYREKIELKKRLIAVTQNYSAGNIRTYLNKLNQVCNSMGSVQIISYKYSNIKIGDVILSEDNWIDFNILNSSASFECTNFVLTEEMEEDEIEMITIKFLSILNIKYRSHLTGHYLTFELDSPCVAVYESTNNFLKSNNTVTIVVTEDTMKFQKFVIGFFQKMSKQFIPEHFPIDQNSNSPQFFNFNLRLNSNSNLRACSSHSSLSSPESDTVSGKYSLILPARRRSGSDSQLNSSRCSSVANSEISYGSSAIVDTSQKSLKNSQVHSPSEILSSASPNIQVLNPEDLNLSVAETVITQLKEECPSPAVTIDQIDLITPPSVEDIPPPEPIPQKSPKQKRKGRKRSCSKTEEVISSDAKKSRGRPKKPIMEFKKNSYFNFEDESFFTDSDRCTRTSTRTVRPPKRLIDEIDLIRDGYTTDSTLAANRKKKIRQLQQTTELTTDIPTNPDILTSSLTSLESVTISGQRRIKTILPVKKAESKVQSPASIKSRRNTISGPEVNSLNLNNSDVGLRKIKMTNIKLIDYLEEQQQNRLFKLNLNPNQPTKLIQTEQQQNNLFKLNLNPNQPTKLIQTCGQDARQESNLNSPLNSIQNQQHPVLDAFDKLLLGYPTSPDPNKRSAIHNFFGTSSSDSQKNENVPEIAPINIPKVVTNFFGTSSIGSQKNENLPEIVPIDTPKVVTKRGRKSNTEPKKPKSVKKNEPKQSRKNKKDNVSTASTSLVQNQENLQILPVEKPETIAVSEIDNTMNKIHSIFNNFKNTYDKLNDQQKYKFYDLFKDFFNSFSKN